MRRSQFTVQGNNRRRNVYSMKGPRALFHVKKKRVERKNTGPVVVEKILDFDDIKQPLQTGSSEIQETPITKMKANLMRLKAKKPKKKKVNPAARLIKKLLKAAND